MGTPPFDYPLGCARGFGKNRQALGFLKGGS